MPGGLGRCEFCFGAFMPRDGLSAEPGIAIAGRLDSELGRLRACYGALSGAALLRPLIEREFNGRIALVSSFGTQSAVLLHMVASIDRGLPVLFIDTRKLFGETLRYRDALVTRLGLTDVRTIRPSEDTVAAVDADGMLWQRGPDACCNMRKVAPLASALGGFSAWISGRKRYQGGLRADLPVIESAGDFIKINPLAGWSAADIEREFAAHDLPRHPLEAEGFPSVGCLTCTARVAPGADPRSGRWPGMAKTECGIHLDLEKRSA
jgi:phosphoadenosine phosphosulfate reductase